MLNFPERSRSLFLSVGWLLPVIVPTAALYGRALSNIVFGVYFFWLLLVLRPRDFRIDPFLIAAHAAVVIVFLASTVMAMDGGESVYKWFRWASYTMVLPATVLALSVNGLDEQRLLRWFGVSVSIALLGFLFFLVKAWWQGAVVAQSINGMVIAYLLPFIVAWLHQPGSSARMVSKSWLSVSIVVIAMMMLLLADSSTEVLVAGVGMLTFLALYLRNGMRLFWAIFFLVPAVLVVEVVPKWTQMQGLNWLAWLDMLSSHRTAMWLGMLDNPPDNIWLGVGVGHARYFEPLLSIGVRGYHNFVFDIWYETGVLGLVFFAIFLAVLFFPVLRGLREASSEMRKRAAPWVAGVAAILVAASLDHSYGSVSFALTMLFELAVLRVLLASARR